MNYLPWHIGDVELNIHASDLDVVYLEAYPDLQKLKGIKKYVEICNRERGQRPLKDRAMNEVCMKLMTFQ
jgi:hypothetical protein